MPLGGGYPPGLAAEARSLKTRHEELAAIGAPPDRPAVLLSGAAEPKIPEEHRAAAAAAGLDEERMLELHRLKLELGDALVAKLPRGRHVHAGESGHYVHWDQPGLVADTILDLLREIRGPR